ncbi:MAG: class I SAM-dependent methyltransferase [Subdoligranulum sp.]
MTTLHTCKPVPHLDARLAAAAAYVRPGHIAADIGCDHGKLSAWLAGSGCCPLVFACDLREGPLQKARMTCAPWADKIQFRLGSGLSVLQPGEATEIIIAGMGAETVLEILDAAPWVRNEQYNFVFVPATKHSVLRKGLAQRGFALKKRDTVPCSRAAVYRDQRAVYRPGSGAHRPCLPVRQNAGPARSPGLP